MMHFFRMNGKEIEYICNVGGQTSTKNITNDYFKVTCPECKEMLVKERIRMELRKAAQGTMDWLNWLKDDENCSNKDKLPKWAESNIDDYLEELHTKFVKSEQGDGGSE